MRAASFAASMSFTTGAEEGRMSGQPMKAGELGELLGELLGR
jgi:hypothetical protein